MSITKICLYLIYIRKNRKRISFKLQELKIVFFMKESEES